MALICSLALCFFSLCVGIQNKKAYSLDDLEGSTFMYIRELGMFICVYPLLNGLYVQLQPMYDVSE